MFFCAHFVSPCAEPEKPEDIVWVHSPMPKPSVHPVHSAVDIIARDTVFLAHPTLHFLLESLGQDFVGIQPQHPLVFQWDGVQSPVKLVCVVDKFMLRSEEHTSELQ